MSGGFVRELVAGLVLACPSSFALQNAQEIEKPTSVVDENFSGTVTALSAESVSVVRTSWSKETVSHVFLLDAETRIEGKLRAKARVTHPVRLGRDQPALAQAQRRFEWPSMTE